MKRIIPLEAKEVDQLKAGLDTILGKTSEMLSNLRDPNTMNEEHWIRLMAAFPIFAMKTCSVALETDLQEHNSVKETWAAARDNFENIPAPAGFKNLVATIIEKRGVCPAYEEGENFEISSPFSWPRHCPALWFSAWPYIIAAGFGYKSWESDDTSIFRISCPSKKGLVLQIAKK